MVGHRSMTLMWWPPVWFVLALPLVVGVSGFMLRVRSWLVLTLKWAASDWIMSVV